MGARERTDRRDHEEHRQPAGRGRRLVHSGPVVHQSDEEGTADVLPLLVRCGVFLRSSEECVELVQEELLCSLQRVELPLFASCPVFKKRLLETLQSLIRTWAQADWLTQTGAEDGGFDSRAAGDGTQLRERASSGLRRNTHGEGASGRYDTRATSGRFGARER